MTKTTFLFAATALVGALAGAPAQAQNLTAMNNAFNARLNAAMAASQNRIVGGNMSKPAVIAAYQSGICGRGLSLQQVAYTWAATGGCTAQGRAFYMQNEARNRGNEMVALNGYRQAQGNFAGAIAQRNGNFAQNTYDRGAMLGGWNYAYRPNGGWVWYR